MMAGCLSGKASGRWTIIALDKRKKKKKKINKRKDE